MLVQVTIINKISIYLSMSRLTDFMTCSCNARLYIQSEGSILSFGTL